MKPYAVLCSLLIFADQLVKLVLPTPYWGWDSRPITAIMVVLGVGSTLILFSYPPIRLGGTIMLAGMLSNTLSAANGDVPNPFVIGNLAFNLADTMLVGGLLVIVASVPAVFTDIRERGTARGWK